MVTVGATVYPAPGFVILKLLRILLVSSKTATAVALIPPTGAVEIATIGVEVYPAPSAVIVKSITPLDTVSIDAVAAAPTPLPLTNVIFGGVKYPEPAFVRIISFTACAPLLVVVIATAVASTPPAGAGVMNTEGGVKYP